MFSAFFSIKNMPNPNGGLRSTVFALCTLLAFTLSARGAVITCAGHSDSATMQCSTYGSAAIFDDTKNTTVSCPCSDTAPGLAGTIQYLCQDASWKETFRACTCTTCNYIEQNTTSTPILGGKRTKTTMVAQCQSGCSCDSSCSGTYTAYVCKCSGGYTVVNQDTESCSCEENTNVGVCYVEYCNDGFYSTGRACIKCPNPSDKTIISGDIKTGGQNTGDVNSCYITKSTIAKDDKGTFVLESNCNY